jgi:hypothetical protein
MCACGGSCHRCRPEPKPSPLTRHEWEPNDVVIGSINRWTGRLFRADSNDAWIDGDRTEWSDDHVHNVRPLVVIDPEDREQVERIRGCFTDAGLPYETCRAELLALSDSWKPPEPTGLGAVVEAADGQRWLRTAASVEGCVWRLAFRGTGTNHVYAARSWDGIAAVKVLSEGVVA